MALVSATSLTSNFIKKLANGTVMVYIENATAPWTGTIVGAKSGQTLIFTAAHCIKIPELSQEAIEAKLRVMFNDDPIKYPVDICLNLEKSEILILRVNRNTDSENKFEFAPEGQHNLRRFQPVVTYAHPHGCLNRSAEGTICSEGFTNADIGYDEQMLFFNHRMDLPNGCSGASIFNQSGKIVGLQSGIYKDIVNVMGPGPFDNFLRKRKDEFKQASKEKLSTKQLGSVSMADEMRSLNDELGKVTVNFSEGSCMGRDTIPLKIAISDMKYAVHIKYLDDIIRKKVFNGSSGPLDNLLEDMFIAGS